MTTQTYLQPDHISTEEGRLPCSQLPCCNCLPLASCCQATSSSSSTVLVDTGDDGNDEDVQQTCCFHGDQFKNNANSTSAEVSLTDCNFNANNVYALREIDNPSNLSSDEHWVLLQFVTPEGRGKLPFEMRYNAPFGKAMEAFAARMGFPNATRYLYYYLAPEGEIQLYASDTPSAMMLKNGESIMVVDKMDAVRNPNNTNTENFPEGVKDSCGSNSSLYHGSSMSQTQQSRSTTGRLWTNYPKKLPPVIDITRSISCQKYYSSTANSREKFLAARSETGKQRQGRLN